MKYAVISVVHLESIGLGVCEHLVVGSNPDKGQLVMLGRASSHNCSCASFE